MRSPVPRCSECGDGLDQRATDAAVAHGLVGEQILEGADRPEHRGAAMEQVVREADGHAVDLGEPRVNRLGRIEQPGPQRIGDLRWQRGRADAAVIAAPSSSRR